MHGDSKTIHHAKVKLLEPLRRWGMRTQGDLQEKLGVRQSIASHEINSHVVNSHVVNSHVVNSYKTNLFMKSTAMRSTFIKATLTKSTYKIDEKALH